jgi:hypothetical protein
MITLNMFIINHNNTKRNTSIERWYPLIEPKVGGSNSALTGIYFKKNILSKEFE